jgi:hypothetical protein
MPAGRWTCIVPQLPWKCTDNQCHAACQGRLIFFS